MKMVYYNIKKAHYRVTNREYRARTGMKNRKMTRVQRERTGKDVFYNNITSIT